MDLISKQKAIDAVESAKTVRTPDGEIYVAKLNAEMNIQILPSAEPLTERDYTELRNRFGEYVEFVVRDMISGKGERWTKNSLKKDEKY